MRVNQFRKLRWSLYCSSVFLRSSISPPRISVKNALSFTESLDKQVSLWHDKGQLRDTRKDTLRESRGRRYGITD